jgi:hypothetical protein
MTPAEIIVITKLASDQFIFWGMLFRDMQGLSKEEVLEKIEDSETKRKELFGGMGVKK